MSKGFDFGILRNPTFLNKDEISNQTRFESMLLLRARSVAMIDFLGIAGPPQKWTFWNPQPAYKNPIFGPFCG